MRVLRVHADRVYDGVIRSGRSPAVAAHVVESTGGQLIEASVGPQPLGDPVGWWFGRALEVTPAAGPAARTAAATGAEETGGGPGDDQSRLVAALDRQPPPGRTALLLRDCYDLRALSVGTALGLSEAGVYAQLAAARLGLLAEMSRQPAPSLDGHDVDLAVLGRLGEREQVAPSDATVFRHARTCPTCRAVVDAQDLARHTLAGLVVTPLPGDQLEAMLDRLEARARQALDADSATRATPPTPTPPPASSVSAVSAVSARAVNAVVAVPVKSGRELSLVALALGLIAAVGSGAVIGLLLPSRGQLLSPAEALASAPPLVKAPAPPAPVPVRPPTVETAAPLTSVFTLPPVAVRTTPPPLPQAPPSLQAPPSPLPAAPSVAAAVADVTVTPASGPADQSLVVTGAGWPPGATVALDLLGPDGTPTGSEAQAVADADGAFGAELTAFSAGGTVGRHTVRVSDDVRTVERPYDVTVP